MSKSPLKECEEQRLSLGNLWLSLRELVSTTYKAHFIAKNLTEESQMLRHMGDQHSRIRTEYHLLSLLTGYKLCPECKGEKAVTEYGELEITVSPCEVCEAEGIVKR